MQNHHNAMWARRHERRGWLTAVLAAAPVIIQATGSASGGNAKDQERFAKTQAAYAEAIKGNVDALNYLKYMSGRYGASNCGQYGACSGWATQVAKDYSGKLYQQAIAVLQGQLPQGTPVPTTPAATTPNPVQVTTTFGGRTGGGSTIQVGPNPPQTQQQQRQGTLLWVLLAVVVVGGIALYMTRRQRS